MPSIFETDARKEGRKSESTLKSELEEYDPEDPEFDPSDEPPKKSRKIKNVPKGKLEKHMEAQPDDGGKVKGKEVARYSVCLNLHHKFRFMILYKRRH